MKIRIYFLPLLIFINAAQAQVTTPRVVKKRPIALVYQGPGACDKEEGGCSAAAATVARMAGYTVKFVGPDALSDEATPAQVKAFFSGAKVWVQPGGIANEAYDTMTDKLTDSLVAFVKNGGGYVGFCAGAFMATSFIGGTGGEGLGIIPGRTDLYHGGFDLSPVEWLGKSRKIYFEGGPYFYGFDQDPETKVEVTATYETGAAAAIRAPFGKGRVWVTGLHPEAPLIWTKEDGIVDPDGIEQKLAAEMIAWAGGKGPVKLSPPRNQK